MRKRRNIIIPVFVKWTLLALIAAMPRHSDAQKPKLMLPSGHVGGAELSFSPDGRKMLSLGNDGTAKIWDLQNGLMLADLQGHRGKIVNAGFSTDGKRIFTSSEDNTVRIWSTASGEILQTLGQGRGTLRSFEFHSGDKLALLIHYSGEVTTATTWDVTTGKLLREIKESRVLGEDGKLYGLSPILTISPDGRSIAGSDIYHFRADSGIIVISDTRSGQRRDTLEGYFAGIQSIQYSASGKYIVALGGHQFDSIPARKSDIASTEFSWAAITWNASNGKILDIHKLERSKYGNYWDVRRPRLWFDQVNKDFLFADDGYTIEGWNVLTGKPVSSLLGHTGKSRAYVLGESKRTVIISDGKMLKIADLLSGKITDSFPHNSEIEKFRVDEKNKVAITVTKNNLVHIWDIRSRKLLRTYDGGEEKILSFEQSPVESHLAVYSEHRPVEEEAEGDEEGDEEEEQEEESDDEEEEEGLQEVKIWDWSSDKILWTTTLPETKLEFEFSPDGKSLALYTGSTSYNYYGKIDPDQAQVLDLRTGKKKSNFTGHASYVLSGAFSPDEKRLVTSYSDSTFRIWDMEKGQFSNTLTGHRDVVNRVEFNADGTYLASASNDSTARVWDALSGKQLYALGDNEGPVYSARFSPDMKYVVTISEDDGKVWDAGTGKLLHVLKGAGGIEARFSPDGKLVLCGSRLWNVSTGKLLFELDWHNGSVNHSQFSSDGKYIITASTDETAKLWSVEYGEMLYSFDDHTDEVVFAAFSRDDKKVITASLDNTVKTWDVHTGSLERSVDLGANTVVVDMHIRGNQLLCVTAGSETKVVNLTTGEPVYSFFSLEKNGYLVVDRFNRFDGTENARKLLYFTCNDEVIELDQVKDQLWTPGLAGRITRGDSINALKLSDLDICGLTPQVKETAVNDEAYHFRITPRRGGLGETALYLNGIEIRRFAKSQLKPNGGSYDLIFQKRELQPYLIPGEENAVQVKAWVQDNTISSRGLIVKLDKSKDSTSNPDLYAVFVGISDYKGDELDLKYAAKDAGDMALALSAAARKLLNTDGKEHVFTYHLTTASGYYRFPEKNAIRKTLEEIGEKAKANDILLLFFAGHGVMETGNKKQFYFLTADASRAAIADAVGEMGISTAELTEWLKPARVKAQKRILIFDACNSGQAINDFVQLGKPEQNYKAARNDKNGQQIKAIERLNSQSGMIILSASASDQYAYEMGRYSQGLLTYSLLKVMKQQPEILENGKYLDVTNWLNASKKLAGQLAEGSGARQDPQLNTNNNFNIGIVDEDVRSRIVLSSEKPLFTRSNFQNVQTRIDDLKLRQATDREFLQISGVAQGDITFSADYDGTDGYSLNGDYQVNGSQVVINVLLVKGGTEIKYRFEIKGSVSDLSKLAGEMTCTAVAWIKSN